jgi:hypothetical protein
MWTLMKALALRLVVGRTLGGLLGALLLVLVPVAGVLKIVGLPLLIVLGVIGAPLFLLLAAIGLPVLLVVGVGVVLMFLLGIVFTLGVLAIKIVLPIVLLVWFVRWILGRTRRSGSPDVGPGSPDVGPGSPDVGASEV